MKLLFITIALCFLYFLGHGQSFKKSILLNAKDSSEIPFATVKVLNNASGTFSNNEGIFEVLASFKDSILISSIGYVNKVVSITNFSFDTIFLSPAITKLPEIVIKKKVLISKETLGIIEEKNDFNWGPSGFGEEFAQKIKILNKSNDEQIKITKIILLVKNFDPVYPVLLHLYSVDNKTGFPLDELLQRQYFISKKNLHGKKIIVDLSKENLFVSENEIFVGFQWLSKTSESNNASSGTLLQMTKAVNETITYSRTQLSKQYNWFPAPPGPSNNRPSNTMFSIEIERYK